MQQDTAPHRHHHVDADEHLAAELRAELAEMTQIAAWRTRQAWNDFEEAWRAHAASRRHIVPAAVLEERRRMVPVDWPSRPWTAEQLDRSTWRPATEKGAERC